MVLESDSKPSDVDISDIDDDDDDDYIAVSDVNSEIEDHVSEPDSDLKEVDGQPVPTGGLPFPANQQNLEANGRRPDQEADNAVAAGQEGARAEEGIEGRGRGR